MFLGLRFLYRVFIGRSLLEQIGGQRASVTVRRRVREPQGFELTLPKEWMQPNTRMDLLEREYRQQMQRLLPEMLAIWESMVGEGVAV